MVVVNGEARLSVSSTDRFLGSCGFEINPVKRGLVERPDQWHWSSFRSYFYGEPGLVRVNFQEWPLEIKPRPVEKFADDSGPQRPLIREVRE